MNKLWNWLKPDSSSGQQFHEEAVSICCSDTCQWNREVCPCQKCAEKHKGHILMPYKKFKENHANVIQEIKCRQKIQDIIREYNQKIMFFLDDLLQKQTIKLLNDIEKKVFGKNFIQIYKRELSDKNYYSLIPQFSSTYGEKAINLVQKAISFKQKKVADDLNNLIITNRILIEHSLIGNLQKSPEDPLKERVEKIKSILPFACQLNKKFTASINRFQASNLHKIGIKGPILLVVESNKGKIFGGFSPKMFPKDEYYEEDNRCRSFLFSLDNKTILPLKEQYKKFAIKGGNNLWFGRGDLVIADQCNKANISWAQIGRAYELPPEVGHNSDEYLAGSVYFTVVQYEIYEVQTTYFMKN